MPTEKTTFRVLCIKNTDGQDNHGQVPPIPKVGDEDLQIGKTYQAVRIKSGILAIIHNNKTEAVLPEHWFET